MTRARFHWTVKILSSILIAFPSLAQVPSRPDLIQQARREKAARLSKPLRSKIEKFLLGMEQTKFLEKMLIDSRGLGPVLGGLETSQGFALGPGYRKGRDYIFELSARASNAKAYLLETSLLMPMLADDKLEVRLAASHRNYPRMEYFGPGPDSDKGSRSVYRLEGPSLEARTALTPLPFLKFGVLGGYTDINVGPGIRPGIASTHDVFTPAVAPGIDNQTGFWRSGVFAEVDYRDIPGGHSHSGGYYAGQFVYHDDRGLGRYSFRRLDLEAQQYYPFFNGKRIIALRMRTAMTWAPAGHAVPFYFQPHVGGADDLRGFRPYRFYDNNHIVANIEYRWESFSGLDMAIFFDAGKVTPRRSQINFHDLETSAGFGFRFNQRNMTFMRLDFGFSHEGIQAWLKFGSAF